MPDSAEMSDSTIFICESSAVEEGGRGVRFPLTAAGEDAVGFVVRFEQEVHAYLNRCAHVPMELDWNQGEFFEPSGLFLMCATHGALYEPNTGKCAGGPCRGGSLKQIKVVEKEHKIFWQPDDVFRPVLA